MGKAHLQNFHGAVSFTPVVVRNVSCSTFLVFRRDKLRYFSGKKTFMKKQRDRNNNSGRKGKVQAAAVAPPSSEDEERRPFTEILNKPAQPLVSEGQWKSLLAPGGGFTVTSS